MERDPRVWIATLRNSHERLAALVEPLSPEQVRHITSSIAEFYKNAGR